MTGPHVAEGWSQHCPQGLPRTLGSIDTMEMHHLIQIEKPTTFHHLALSFLLSVSGFVAGKKTKEGHFVHARTLPPCWSFPKFKCPLSTILPKLGQQLSTLHIGEG